MPVKTKRDEEKWEKAKAIAAESGHKEDYAYIMGIYKRMKPDYEFKSGPAAKHASAERVAARFASRYQIPTQTSSARKLKQQGLLPVDEFFGEVLPRPNRPVVMQGEFVQDRKGEVFFFVGLDERGKAILAETEREYRSLRNELEELRLHHVTPEKRGAWIPGERDDPNNWEAGYRGDPDTLEEGDGSQVPPARDNLGNELE